MEIKSLIHQVSIEFISTMMFHVIGSISPTAIANGLALIVMVYYSAKISGGHLNPAVSFTFLILGHINIIEFFAYILSQFSGAIVGGLLIAALIPGASIGQTIQSDMYSTGCFTPIKDLSDSEVFFWEFVFTTIFIIPIFSVVWYTQNKNGYGNTGPIIVGLSLFSNALACGPYTGASLNPARSLGSFAVFDCEYRNIYTYILGEFLGGFCAALFIMPWYGISNKPWYASETLTAYLLSGSKHNIEIKTI
jgi:MIP family channel proteins